MRKVVSTIIGMLTLSMPAFSAVQGAYYNHFAIEGDYVLLRRANGHNTHLVEAGGGPINYPPSKQPPQCAKEAGKTLIDTKDLVHHMHFTSGFSGAIKLFPSIYSTWEARYTGGFAWRGKKVYHCLENLNIAGPFAYETFDYNFANRAKALYDSDMSTYELNYHHHVTPRYTDHFSVSWLAGLRYFSIDEKVKLYFTKHFPVKQTSRYRTRTENSVFGLQFGGSIEYNPYHFLTWGLSAKAGGMFNRGKQRTLMLDQNNTVTIVDVDRSGSNFAYMGQFYPYIELRPTKHFFFQVSYQVLYVGNIETADRNIRFHGSGSLLDHNGHVLYHGLTSGIQFNF